MDAPRWVATTTDTGRPVWVVVRSSSPLAEGDWVTTTTYDGGPVTWIRK